MPLPKPTPRNCGSVICVLIAGILLQAYPAQAAAARLVEFITKGENNINGYYFSPTMQSDLKEGDTCYWRLQLIISKPSKSPYIKYSEIKMCVFDNRGKAIPISRAEPIVDNLFERHAQGVALGRYLMSSSKSQKPTSVDITWLGEKRTLRFVERQTQDSKGR